MEPPNALNANAIRDEVIKVPKAIQPFDHQQVLRDAIRGQYSAEILGITYN